MERARLAGTQESILYVAFLSAGQRFLLDARNVVEAADYSQLVPIPGAKPWAAGVANVKGDAFAVTDFAALYGGPITVKGKFLTLDDELMPGAALQVEQLLGLLGPEAIGQPEAIARTHSASWIIATHRVAGETYLLISGELLAADPKFSNLQSGEHQDELQG
jgi:twitching motility protein PilI